MHLLYVIASYLLFVVALPVLLWHPKLRHGVPFRLGFYRGAFDSARGPRGSGCTARARATSCRSSR